MYIFNRDICSYDKIKINQSRTDNNNLVCLQYFCSKYKTT